MYILGDVLYWKANLSIYPAGCISNAFHLLKTPPCRDLINIICEISTLIQSLTKNLELRILKFNIFLEEHIMVAVSHDHELTGTQFWTVSIVK